MGDEWSTFYFFTDRSKPFFYDLSLCCPSDVLVTFVLVDANPMTTSLGTSFQLNIIVSILPKVLTSYTC